MDTTSTSLPLAKHTCTLLSLSEEIKSVVCDCKVHFVIVFSFLVVFPLRLQLPIKVGHQNTHTKVSTEHNKECLINISKYKFSLVISGLTTILKNVNNMVSGQRGRAV